MPKSREKQRILSLRRLIPTVAEYLDHLKRKNSAKGTIEKQGYALCVFMDWLELQGISTPEQASEELIEEYQVWLAEERLFRGSKDVSKGGQAQNLMAVRGLYRWLLSERLIFSDPAANIKLPKKEKRIHRDILSVDELKSLVFAPDKATPYGLRDAVVLRLFGYAGVRASELCGINLADLDINEREIRIRGKGKKERMVFFDRLTQKQLKEYIPIVRSALQKRSCSALVLHDSGRRMKRHEVREIVQNYGIKAHIKKSINCHSLRRTFGSLMLTKGNLGLRQLAEIMGHELVETTAVYAHVDISELSAVYKQAHPRSQL